MSITNRRTFMLHVVVGGSAIAASQAMAAPGAPLVSDTDANAVALGYKSDATKIDLKKYPAHKPTQHCGTCALFQGKAADADGPCPLFAGKHVSSKGWCSAYAPKAG